MIYLDNAATTKPNENAIKQAEKYLFENFYNPSAMYKEGHEVQSELKTARLNLLSCVANESDFEVIFTSCGTESDNQAIFSFAKRGNVVTTEGEHSAVYASFLELKNKGIAQPRFAPLLSDGRVDVEKLVQLVDEKTSFVSVIHVNNETGAINDVNEIAKRVKKKNPRVVFHSDGVQAFGKIPFKLCKEIDLYSVSAHKIGGLKGVGALIKRKSLTIPPYIFGGGQENGRRSGTENVFGIMQFVSAAKEKFLTLKEDFNRLTEYKKLLIDRLDKSIYTVLSGENSTPYITSISAVGLRGEILLHILNDKGLIVGTGSACSSNSKNRFSRVILACGVDEKTADGVIRISFSSQTTKEETEKALTLLNECGRELKARMS